MTVYSHSRLSAFEQCRLKYKFMYIDRIRGEGESIEAFLGSRFHETMEHLYRGLPRVPAEEELVAYFDERWASCWDGTAFVTQKGMTPEDYREVGRNAVKEYYRKYRPFDSAKTIGIERRLEIDLSDSGDHRVQCFIDRLDKRPDGTVEIHDYKTSAVLPEQKKLDEDRQLGLYELAVRRAWPDIEKVELVWHFVRFGEEMRSRRTPEQLEDLRANTIALIDEIESAKEFPPEESALCPWCEFIDICPLFSHMFKAAEVPAGLDDGAAVVDRYAELEAKKKELRAKVKEIEIEQDALKEAAIAIADREGVTRLYGKDHKISIKHDVAIRYPKVEDRGRAEFEKRLKDLGVWERVIDINYMALHGLAKRSHWLESLPLELEGFVTIDPVKRIYLSKHEEDE